MQVKELLAQAKVGVPGRTVAIDPATYFLGTRMERSGMLRSGQALMLSATLPTKPQTRGQPKRGKTK